MISAFGVDHGEIYKRKKKPPRTFPNHPAPPTGPQKIAAAAHRAGEAPISVKGIGSTAGGSLREVGSFMQRRPGVTGLAVTGAAGYGTYRHLKQKEPKRKKES